MLASCLQAQGSNADQAESLMISGAKYRLMVIAGMLLCGMLPPVAPLPAETIPVHHVEGVTHGFVVMRDATGRTIAFGDMIQETKHGLVTSRLTFHYNDGSLYDDTTIYSEHGVFRVLSDHLIEKGPSFKEPMEAWLDTKTGEFRARSFEKGKDKIVSQRLKVPSDVSNGILYVVAKNIDPKATTTVSMVVGTPKPRVVKMIFTSDGGEQFLVGGMRREATHFVIRVDIGGVAGAVAPLVGKQPANMDLWIAADSVPTFLKMQGPLYDGGPIWTVELAVPRWIEKSSQNAQQSHPK